FLNPIRRIGTEELAHPLTSKSIEVNRLSPFVLISVGEVIWRKSIQIIPIGTEMIINDVQDHSQAQDMCLIYEGPKIVRLTIQPCRGKQVNPVISPTKPAGKFRDRHNFEQCHSQPSQFL